MKSTPLQRLTGLLKVDRKDVTQIILYAVFAGLVSLSLPLGIQAIINLIQSGQVSASWILLVVIVVFGVALGGVLSVMQLRITENLQQKIFIRSSFEFS
jgi:ABC-type bacteriocin/lantibiotic exporter with double-glycine peptidase domain